MKTGPFYVIHSLSVHILHFTALSLGYGVPATAFCIVISDSRSEMPSNAGCVCYSSWRNEAQERCELCRKLSPKVLTEMQPAIFIKKGCVNYLPGCASFSAPLDAKIFGLSAYTLN